MATPIHDQPILSAIEVLRTGHDDFADPDLAHVAQAVQDDPSLAERLSRIERSDEQLAAAFHDVDVPAGLEDRLLAGLATNAESPTSADGHDALPSVERRAPSNRVVWAAVATVAASIVVAAWVIPRDAEVDLTKRDALLDQAIAFFNNDTTTGGTAMADQLPPSNLAISDDVRHTDGATWRPIDDFLGTPAVAYDLVGPRGEQATLYVTERRLQALEMVTLPSTKPDLSTGGISATCWQNDDLLYVLVVAGEREQYGTFVRQPGSTIAVRVPAGARFAQAA
ncbi:MAG: hypothetical protein MI757_20580 [Pirellulales bacterium]|nr:hypothetical protein [Pirellulales bacterium]